LRDKQSSLQPRRDQAKHFGVIIRHKRMDDAVRTCSTVRASDCEEKAHIFCDVFCEDHIRVLVKRGESVS
jgi:hypothetical protein